MHKMFVTTMINKNNNTLTSEARAFIYGLFEYGYADCVNTIEKICCVLNECGNVDQAYAMKVRKVFPNPSIVELQDILDICDYEVHFVTNDPHLAKLYIERELFTDYGSMYPWCTINGDREMFAVGMIENGSWTHETMQDFWYMLQTEGDYFVFVDDLIELKQICAKHPEWNIKHDILWDEIVKDFDNFYEYHSKLIDSGLATDKELVDELSKRTNNQREIVADFIRRNDTAEAMTYLYSLPQIDVQSVVHSLASSWEDNIDILKCVKQAIPHHPEWQPLVVYIDPYYVGSCDITDRTELNIKTLLDAGLIEKNFLNSFVRQVLTYNISDEIFEILSKIRSVAQRNPDLIIDWSCCDVDMAETEFVERLVLDGYWTRTILQENIKKTRDVSKLHKLRDLISKHRDWGVSLEVDNPKLAYELGLDFTHANQMTERFRAIGSKL